MNECIVILPLEQPLEFSVASDFLYENGFYDASAALRILYPKLPQSMLNKVYIFRELTKEGVDISRFKLRLRVDSRYDDDDLVEVHCDCDIDSIKFSDDIYNDVRNLVIKCTGTVSNITSQSYMKDLSLVVDGKILLTMLTNTSTTVMPGDSVNLQYAMEMPDYLLPSEVVSNFKSGYSRRMIEVISEE